MKNRYLLDSWAMVAYLKDEPAGDKVTSLLQEARKGPLECGMSIINLGEVYYVLIRLFGLNRARDLLSAIRATPLRIIPVSEEQVMRAAEWKAGHRMSYADAFAVAAALEWNATVATGDPEILALSDRVPLLDLTRG